MRKPVLFIATALVAVLSAHAAEPTEGEKLFALKVKPLFAEKCHACHGEKPDKLKGEFDMRTRESMLKGGETFENKVLIPGKGEESFLYITTTRKEEDFEMPPKEADQLSEEQQWWIRDWINAGAPWPDDERVAAIQEKYAEGEKVATSKALGEEWQNRRYESEKLWAYRPLTVVEVPDGQHPVDFFVNRKLEALGLEPARAAGARELGRRLSFGLTGLPPEPARLAAFESDFKTAPAKAVDDYASELRSSLA